MEEQLLLKIHQLRRRLRWVESTRQACLWGLGGFWLALLAGIVLKLLDRPLADQLASLWLFPATLAAGGLRGWLRAPTLKQAALRTDQRKSLKERLLTALDTLGQDRAETATSRFLLQDAWHHAQSLDPREVFPNPWVRPAARWLVPGLLCALVLATPSWGSWLSPVPPDEVAAVRRSSDRLGRLAERLRRERPHSPQAARAASRLEELARALKQANVRKSTAADKIDQANRELGKIYSDSKAARPGAQGRESELKELARKLAQGGNNAANREALAKEIAKAEGQRKEMLEKAARQLAENQKEEAARSTEQAARSAQGEPKEDGESAQDREAAQEAQEELQSESETLDPGNSHFKPQQEGQAGRGVARNGSRGPGQKSDEKGEADFGVGTTNEKSEAPAGKPKDYVLERQSKEKPSDWKERYEQLYQAERRHFAGTGTRIKGQRGKGQLIRTQGFGWGAPRRGDGPRLSPQAGELFLRSKQGAEQAISQGEVPGDYRQSVRNYFDNIDPRR